MGHNSAIRPTAPGYGNALPRLTSATLQRRGRHGSTGEPGANSPCRPPARPWKRRTIEAGAGQFRQRAVVLGPRWCSELWFPLSVPERGNASGDASAWASADNDGPPLSLRQAQGIAVATL